jgi:GT2 family glycosyltransferase
MSSPADAVTVVIPNYNGRSLLPRALEALAAQIRQPERILVVDNASTDGSPELAESAGVEVVRRTGNGGFGAAANDGLRRCATPNLVVLNADARPAPGWLAALGDAGPVGPDIWAWGSVLVSATTGLVESAGDFVHRTGQSGKHLGGRPLDDLPADPFEVLAPPGAAPMVRADVVRELGGWFEPYFLYYEDLDLAMRARLAGYRAFMVPAARVEHDLAGSSGGRPPWDHIARSSTWCTVRTNPSLTAAGFARLHVREYRIARRHGGAAPWARGKARAIPALPKRLAERRRLMRDAVDRHWIPGPPG